MIPRAESVMFGDESEPRMRGDDPNDYLRSAEADS